MLLTVKRCVIAAGAARPLLLRNDRQVCALVQRATPVATEVVCFNMPRSQPIAADAPIQLCTLVESTTRACESFGALRRRGSAVSKRSDSPHTVHPCCSHSSSNALQQSGLHDSQPSSRLPGPQVDSAYLRRSLQICCTRHHVRCSSSRGQIV